MLYILKNVDFRKSQLVMDNLKHLFTTMRGTKRSEHVMEGMKLFNKMMSDDDLEKVMERIRDQIYYYVCQKSTALPDPSRYRRVILQPHSIDSAQIPFPLTSEPYVEAAQATDIAAMTARVHISLPEWDISEMLQIVNPALQSKYAYYRHRAAARCNGNPNERMLFHFALDHVIPKIWQTGEGHDPRACACAMSSTLV